MNKKQTKPEQKPKQQTFAELYDECWAQITTESKPKNGYEVLKSKMPLLKKMFDQESKKVEAAQHEKLLTIADFENRRKHLETQAQADFKYRGFELASQIIASLDHMQQALTTTATSPEVTDFLTGFRMIHKKMLKDLEMVGVKPMMIKAGTRFDHSRHHAVEKKTSHKFKPNTVIEVKSPGWFMYDRILKYAQVKVATTPEPKQKASCEHPHSSEHQPKQRPSTNQNKNE